MYMEKQNKASELTTCEIWKAIFSLVFHYKVLLALLGDEPLSLGNHADVELPLSHKSQLVSAGVLSVRP